MTRTVVGEDRGLVSARAEKVTKLRLILCHTKVSARRDLPFPIQ